MERERNKGYMQVCLLDKNRAKFYIRGVRFKVNLKLLKYSNDCLVSLRTKDPTLYATTAVVVN